jgi:hypothetical protein
VPFAVEVRRTFCFSLFVGHSGPNNPMSARRVTGIVQRGKGGFAAADFFLFGSRNNKNRSKLRGVEIFFPVTNHAAYQSPVSTSVGP